MTQPNPPERAFRKDINGLRAWAVIAVILYHFGVSGFSGGFVGVDIFFVISGFLMTSIIVKGLEDQGGFSILKFYLSRAKRIIPALLALCLTITVLGWFYLSESEYKTLARHVISAVTFSSNVRFWKETGYFDAASYDKWLLHTWSLSVEWQFYLVLPVALVIAWKLMPGRFGAILITAGAFIASLSASVALSSGHPSAAFYLLPTRAWEMLAGSLMFFIFSRHSVTPKLKIGMELSGFILIIYSITTMTPSVVWPGWQALLPVLGTALVIGAGRQDSYFTNTAPAQWFGNWSYSLYLWHWPIAAALVFVELRSSTIAILVGLSLTLALGYASFKLIENSSRYRLGTLGNWQALATLSLAAAITLAPSYLIRKNEGIPDRAFAQKINTIVTAGGKRNPRAPECFVGESTPVPECQYGGDELGVIVLGDSHAAAVVRAVERSLPNKSLYALDWSLMSCATIKGLKATDDADYRCAEFVAYALEKQKHLPPNVPMIIINRTSAYLFGPNEPHRQSEIPTPTAYITKPYSSRSPAFLNEMREGIINTACKFAQTRPVYMVRPIPEMKLNVPKTMVRRTLIPWAHGSVSLSLDEYIERNTFVWEAQNEAARRCGVHILNPIPYLCSNGECLGDKDGTPLFYDDNHLNEYGDDVLVPMFSKVFIKEEHSSPSTETTTQAAR
ncbi:acyltransferase family protein [Pseudomonas extremaustralis]|uniref:acyltransferase family protein n=1 Tax=Pseudomonas extremaustralis TaxID=359110 RepID=UPI00240EC2BC|nr:acyltransferase family protein [Pseudomonas extremaustralis]MDG2968443.1 acyltransferase family protein [Pseudomonas extremaustralis]